MRIYQHLTNSRRSYNTLEKFFKGVCTFQNYALMGLPLMSSFLKITQKSTTKKELSLMTIYEYFDQLTNNGLGIEHSEEFEDAINDTLALIKESSLADIESGGDDD